MRNIACDIGIIGAGVAGLVAAETLKAAGLDVQCLEATDRVGGRILTVHDPLSPVPIELGAEFVHGRPPEIWDQIVASNLRVLERSRRALHIVNGKVEMEKQVGEIADRVMSRMAASRRAHDESFEGYLNRSRVSTAIKNWARVHVEGFNAARSDSISVGSLIRESDAVEQIDGDRIFRILNGYDLIPLSIARAIPHWQSILHLSCVAETIRWRPGRVTVSFRSTLCQETATLRCRQLIITIPIGVLQATPPSMGAIQFEPAELPALNAVRSLTFGHVYRITFRFREAFWEDSRKFRDAAFLVSQDKRFFTWWTIHPLVAPLLTGWMAGTAADQFHPLNAISVASEGLASLTRILRRKIPPPEAFYFHDWRQDPYFRGSYSYVPLGASGAREALGKPQSDTLFFTGEAANVRGQGSTVHGAIAAGRRTAELVLKSLSR